MFERYAIYVTPSPETPLATFGASWLGWDSATGQSVPHPVAQGLDIASLTERPRKYGLHGTIKPPFHLAEGQTPDALETAFRRLCAQVAPVCLDGLTLTRLGRFLALTPQGETSSLADTAATFVKELDDFRAPPSEVELERRRARPLSPDQEANLRNWGYPYVLDAFRFHITLSGPLDTPTADAVRRHLAPQLDALALSPFVIGAMTLLGSDKSGRFHQIHRVPLSGAHSKPQSV